VYLLVISVHQFGCLADALGFVLEDRIQEFQILLAGRPTEFRVGPDVPSSVTVETGKCLMTVSDE
jgi:hypothetical protein